MVNTGASKKYGNTTIKTEPLPTRPPLLERSWKSMGAPEWRVDSLLDKILGESKSKKDLELIGRLWKEEKNLIALIADVKKRNDEKSTLLGEFGAEFDLSKHKKDFRRLHDFIRRTERDLRKEFADVKKGESNIQFENRLAKDLLLSHKLEIDLEWDRIKNALVGHASQLKRMFPEVEWKDTFLSLASLIELLRKNILKQFKFFKAYKDTASQFRHKKELDDLVIEEKGHITKLLAEIRGVYVTSKRVLRGLFLGAKSEEVLEELSDKNFKFKTKYLKALCSFKYRPLGGMGGDFFYITPNKSKKSRCVVFALGDISGHGLFTSRFSAVAVDVLKNHLEKIHSRLESEKPDRLSVLFEVDVKHLILALRKSMQHIHFEEKGMFFTMIVGLVDMQTKKVYLYDFGTGLCWHVVGDKVYSGFRGRPRYNWDGLKNYRVNRAVLYVLEPNFQSTSLDVGKGDRLFFITDGIAEAQSGPGDTETNLIFARQNDLIGLLKSRKSKGRKFLADLFELVQAHNKNQWGDDATAFVIEFY